MNAAKSGAAALVVGLYAAISAWIVAGEGEAYRKAHPRPIALKPAVDPPPPPPTVDTPPEQAAAEAEPPKPEPPVARKKAATKKVAPAVEPTAVASTAKPHEVDRAPAPAPPKPPPVDPFWEESDQKKTWELDKLTVADEAQLGSALNQMVRHVHPPLRVGPLPRRMEDAIEPYLKAVTRKDVNYSFTVLDCEAANAFSHPGGYVYVCRGLFDWLAEDEDYALAFALLRELAHVDLAHSINNLKQPAVKDLKIPTVPLFFSVAIPGGYLDEQEFEADRWAAERMLKAGKSRYEILSFLRKLEDYAKKNGFENEKLKPKDEPRVAPVDNHIRSAPIPRSRIKRLKAFLDSGLKN